MAMTGRKPKPAHLRLIGGNAGKRPIPEEVSTRPLRRAPDPPEHLSTTAAQLWRELTPALVAAQLLAEGDVIALGMLCEAYADWTDATSIIDDRGDSGYYTTSNAQGETVWRRHPAAAARREAEKSLRMWLGEFGLTPTARARAARVPDPTDADPAEKYFT